VDSGFWIGLALAVPLAILANLLTPRIQSKLESWTGRRSDRRRRAIEQDHRQAELFSANPGELAAYQLSQLLWIAFFTALFGLVSGGLTVAGQVVVTSNTTFDIGRHSIDVGIALFVVATSVGLIGTLIVLNLAREALKFTSRAQRRRKKQSLRITSAT